MSVEEKAAILAAMNPQDAAAILGEAAAWRHVQDLPQCRPAADSVHMLHSARICWM